MLITRARRDGRSPTVASRFLLRLDAISGRLPRDTRLERLTRALDDPGPPQPVGQPRPSPPAEQRPDRISVTAVDRLKADPFAFYAQAILKLRRIDPVDADHTAAWKGSAVHEVLRAMAARTTSAIPTSCGRARSALLEDEAIHPMLRALWAPRLIEAIDWIAELERDNQAEGRRPLAAEADGEAALAGVTVYGRADRIDRLADGNLAIVDYKTGAAADPESGRCGLRAAVGAARADRARRRVRGRRRRAARLRILVADQGRAAIRQIDASGQGHGRRGIPRPRLCAISPRRRASG